MENKVETEIKNLVSKYAKSIDEADLILAEELWSNSPGVSFIHPRDHEKGLEEIKQNFYVGTMGNRFLERKLDVFDLSINVYGDTAIAEFYWHFIAKFKEDGLPHETKGRETQIYHKKAESSGWNLVHVHYSNMPVTGDREGF
jgi:ketosteroid isomerase-like protein